MSDHDFSWRHEAAEQLKKKMGDKTVETMEADLSSQKDDNPAALEFSQVIGTNFIAEVATKGSDFIYHFYPKASKEFVPDFFEKLTKAFEEVFKNTDRVEAAFVDPTDVYVGLKMDPRDAIPSWAVKVNGYADNPLCSPDVIKFKVFYTLEELLS